MRTHHLAASALTLLLCLLLCGCATAPSRKHALLLASGDEGYYWKNLIEGAQKRMFLKRFPMRTAAPT